MKTQTTNTKPATKPAKTSRNTPIAKAAKAEVKAEVKVETKAVFSLVAGTVAQVIHKGLKQAIAYHVAKGNLARIDAGIQLTPQGQALFTKERVETDPSRFHEVAAFVHGGTTPKEWAGQPVSANVAGKLNGKALQFPNMLYWGSFSSSDMRRAFASLWANPK